MLPLPRIHGYQPRRLGTPEFGLRAALGEDHVCLDPGTETDRIEVDRKRMRHRRHRTTLAGGRGPPYSDLGRPGAGLDVPFGSSMDPSRMPTSAGLIELRPLQ